MKSKYKFGFVILNYITTDDTIKCVESIKQNCSEYFFKIVIVDNASPNNSGQLLEEQYKAEPNIKVIINSDNLGFAKGNNIGFKYLKNEFDCDFIIMCNSDTEVIDNNFNEMIIKKYEETNYAVLGPKEKLKSGEFYPLVEKPRNIIQTKLDILYYKKRLKNYRNYNVFLILRKIYSILIRKKKLNVNEYHENIVLHGAFLIFSKEYINLFDGLNDITYFYDEEEFLFLRLKKYNLKSIYFPNVQILHKHNSSTNASTKNSKTKIEFTSKCHLDSSEKYLKALKGEIKL